MSSTRLELFRQHAEKQRHEAEEPKHKSQAQEQPSLVAEMSRIEHEGVYCSQVFIGMVVKLVVTLLSVLRPLVQAISPFAVASNPIFVRTSP
jgi:hypothetical protein